MLSLGNAEVKPFTLEAFLYPGEIVSVHCYSQHTWRQQGADHGAYIEQLRIRGPIHKHWPPESIHRNFKGIALDTPSRKTIPIQLEPSQLERIGGSVSVSSFQVGIEPSQHKATTLKEQIQEHKSSDTCYACHKSIDPYGFALENFDATGHWRTMYRNEIPHQGTFSYRLEGQFRETSAVDASGEIEGVAFSDIAGLKKSLVSNHKKIAYNFARKFLEYASGYEPTLSQRIALYDLIDDSPEKCRLKKLMTDTLVYLSLGEHP